MREILFKAKRIDNGEWVPRMTEQQEQLLRKYNLVPDHWIVFSETSEKLVILNKRNKARRVLLKNDRCKDRR